jgi:hypothetical protein
MDFKLKTTLGLIMCLLFVGTPVFGESFTIVTPYSGIEENTYVDKSNNLKLKDSQNTEGLYVQSIDPEKYQWNVFLYKTDNINYSDLSGFNFIYDRYFGTDSGVQNVAGIGANYLKMDLDGMRLGPMGSFKMDQDILSLYLRIGRYYKYDLDKLHFTVMPWVGGEWDHLQSSGSIDFGRGAKTFENGEEQYSWLTGINLKMNFQHFLQLEVKPAVTYLNGECYWKKSAMVNVFLTKNLGISYRYDYHETSSGKDALSIFGVAVMF